jgi:hypothetical protein
MIEHTGRLDVLRCGEPRGLIGGGGFLLSFAPIGPAREKAGKDHVF